MGPERGLRGNAALGELDLSRVVAGTAGEPRQRHRRRGSRRRRGQRHRRPRRAARGADRRRRLSRRCRSRRRRRSSTRGCGSTPTRAPTGPAPPRRARSSRRSTAAAPRASWPAGSPASTCASCRAVSACRRWRRARADAIAPGWTIAAPAASWCSTRRRWRARPSTPGRASAARSTARSRRSPRRAASAASTRTASARVLRLPALTEARLRGRIDATFDVAGSGKTLQTLELQGRLGVPHAAIVGGEVRDAVADVRLTRGALEGTLTAAFTNIDPGLAADRPPLAGAVSGSIDAAMATPSITTFSLPDTTGRVAADARAVARRRSAHRSRHAAGHARRRRPRRRVARRRRPARRRDGEGAGRAHARRGVHAAVPHHVRRPGAGGGARRPDRCRRRRHGRGHGHRQPRRAAHHRHAGPGERRLRHDGPRRRHPGALRRHAARSRRAADPRRRADPRRAGRSGGAVPARGHRGRPLRRSRRGVLGDGRRQRRADPRRRGQPWRCRSRPASTCGSIASPRPPRARRGRSPSRPGSSTPTIASTSIAWPWPAGRRRSKPPARSRSATRRRAPCPPIGRCVSR